jgi:hypothetical protein
MGLVCLLPRKRSLSELRLHCDSGSGRAQSTGGIRGAENAQRVGAPHEALLQQFDARTDRASLVACSGAIKRPAMMELSGVAMPFSSYGRGSAYPDVRESQDGARRAALLCWHTGCTVFGLERAGGRR